MLRRIAVQEMLHMGLACNLLAGLGASPLIASRVPIYPGKLKAGGFMPTSPSGWSRSTKPCFGVYGDRGAGDNRAEEPDFKPTGDKLISTFYSAIKVAISKERLSFDTARQIDLKDFFGGSPGPVSTPGEANTVIDFILQQGEGSGGSPFEADPDVPSISISSASSSTAASSRGRRLHLHRNRSSYARAAADGQQTDTGARACRFQPGILGHAPRA